MTIPNRAIGPVVKVKRAKEHFDNLAPQIVKFIGEKPYRFVRDFDSQTREHIIKIQIVKQPPDFLGAAIGDVIHNLRSALDLLACQLVEVGGGTVTRNTSFPIYDSVNKFKIGYIGKVKGASQMHILAEPCHAFRLKSATYSG